METLANKTHALFWSSIWMVAALILAGCSPLALGIPEDTETPTPTVVQVAGATTAPVVTLNVSKNAELGSYLTDESGFTLYSIKGKLVWINRPDGGMQVTYNDMPLYFYSKDNNPGEALGQGAGGKWFVMPLAGVLK